MIPKRPTTARWKIYVCRDDGVSDRIICVQILAQDLLDKILNCLPLLDPVTSVIVPVEHLVLLPRCEISAHDRFKKLAEFFDRDGQIIAFAALVAFDLRAVLLDEYPHMRVINAATTNGLGHSLWLIGCVAHILSSRRLTATDGYASDRAHLRHGSIVAPGARPGQKPAPAPGAGEKKTNRKRLVSLWVARQSR